MWKFYADELEALKPIDILIDLGDCIEGKGPRSGGTELLLPDRNDQVDCAVASIEDVEAKTIFMVYGTSAHTGVEDDWEDQIAKRVNAQKIGSHDWIDVYGVIFDYKHYVGRSSVPYGRHTQIAKEKVWAELWSERGEYPDANVILRGHNHYFAYAGGINATHWLAMSCPALQAYWTKYGTRQKSGTVDFGFVHFDVDKDGQMQWAPRVVRLRKYRHSVLSVSETESGILVK
jgi:hypothetical protein